MARSICLAATCIASFSMPILASDSLETQMKEISIVANEIFVGEIFGATPFKPEAIHHDREIPGFSKPKQQLYEVRFIDKKNGLQALIWINPEDKLAFVACRIGEYQKGSCAYVKGMNGKQTVNVKGRVLELPRALRSNVSSAR